MLPRLAYISDVPVENSYHGSALIYRLLSTYPADKLIVLESNLIPSAPPRRLDAVPYHVIKVGNPRLQRTRFHRIFNGVMFLNSAYRVMPTIDAALDRFQPQAVLSVTHGQLWLQAALLSERRAIPLHLIHHDDWPTVANVPALVQPLLNHRFGAVYRQAASRACVSPFMKAEYQNRYGAQGYVAYPFRARENEIAFPVEPTRETSTGLRVAFAGTINTPGYATLLRAVAEHLNEIGGQLIIFGPITQESAEASGLIGSNVVLKGFTPSAELKGRLREEADVLYAPMSFAGSDRRNMQMGFPSKLADYTAVGLPLLICGPEDCSAVVWAQNNKGSAEIATHPDALRPALARLMAADHRRELATNAITVGNGHFSHSAAWRQFENVLERTESPSA